MAEAGEQVDDRTGGLCVIDIQHTSVSALRGSSPGNASSFICRMMRNVFFYWMTILEVPIVTCNMFKVNTKSKSTKFTESMLNSSVHVLQNYIIRHKLKIYAF